MILATLLFAAFIVGVILLADSGYLGFLYFVYDFPYGDKAGHFILFGTLAFLIILTLLRTPRFRDWGLVAVIAALTLALAIGLEEWSQQFFPERTSSWLDLLFSYAGVTVGAWLAWKVRHIFGKSESV